MTRNSEVRRNLFPLFRFPTSAFPIQLSKTSPFPLSTLNHSLSTYNAPILHYPCKSVNRNIAINVRQRRLTERGPTRRITGDRIMDGMDWSLCLDSKYGDKIHHRDTKVTEMPDSKYGGKILGKVDRIRIAFPPEAREVESAWMNAWHWRALRIRALIRKW